MFSHGSRSFSKFYARIARRGKHAVPLFVFILKDILTENFTKQNFSRIMIKQISD
jgi:hypothetical protein